MMLTQLVLLLAFRDRNAGRDSNLARGTEEAGALPPRRGGRGGNRGRGREYDRRSATGKVLVVFYSGKQEFTWRILTLLSDSEKQVGQGWGSNENEWTDEKAGEQIAQTEAQDWGAQPAAQDWDSQPAAQDWNAQSAAQDWEAQSAAQGLDAPVATSAEPVWDFEAEAAPPAPEEPEEKFKTYADYLAEKAAKAAALGSLPAARQPNEGSRNDTKWKNATPLKKDEEEDVFIAGKEAKARKEKERKQKQIVEIDQRFQEAPRGGRGGGDRGGRGGDRGDRGGRGGRGGGERRGGPRGGPRGGRDGGYRGGNSNAPINLEDSNAFPSLGAS